NQATYQAHYTALLKIFAEVRSQGRHPPRVAFLCPFWDPAKVVAELYRDLYQPGLYSESWFRWENKPLILADPRKLNHVVTFKEQNAPARLFPGHRLGQSFSVDAPLVAVAGSFPTWGEQNSGMTLTLVKEGPGDTTQHSRRFERVNDNAWVTLTF